jgi:hypothetical protein
MKQVVFFAVVFLIVLAALGLRLLGELKRRQRGEGDPEALERWSRHVFRGGDEDWPPRR